MNHVTLSRVWQTPYGVTILATPRNSNNSCQPFEQPLFTEPSNSHTNILHFHKRCMPQTQKFPSSRHWETRCSFALSETMLFLRRVFSPASGGCLPARPEYYISSGSKPESSVQRLLPTWQHLQASSPGLLSEPRLLPAAVDTGRNIPSRRPCLTVPTKRP